MHSVVLDSVHKAFRSAGFSLFRRRVVETYALRGISLEVAPGEVLALLGPNGSGKSTTLKLIATVLLPDRGSVRVQGADTRESPQDVRRQVGFALASERSFFPRLTVRENLEFFAALEEVPRSERTSRVVRVVNEVGLEEHMHKQVMKLSSGMQQRLGIARALIKQPRILLLDEPTRSLDPAAASRLWGLIRDFAGRGISVLLASHDFAEVIASADRVTVLQKGEVLGTRRTAGLSEEQLRSYYLGITGRLDLTSEERTGAWADEVPA